MMFVRRIAPLLFFALMFTLTGCLGDGGSSGSDTQVGRLNFHGFSGLSYQTASQSGTTNARGEFRYYPGETLELRVGDLVIASGVPAQAFISPLEFFTDLRADLQIPRVDDEQLRTHTLTEQALLQEAKLLNLTRFLMSLDWTQGVREGEGIDIRQRVIEQLNAALAALDQPIDFTVSQDAFTAGGDTPSPANQVLASICFYPPDSELCEAPPTEAEIEAAPERPENEDDWDPDVTYKEELQAKRDRILNAVRSLDEIDNEDARTYLRRELQAISTTLAKRYYLEHYVASHPATDTAIKSVRVKKIGGRPQLGEIEAISTRPQDVTVHAWSWQDAEVEYFVSGPPDGESELLIAFRPENTYRWVRKSLRVIIR
jgi:hypothetical protein